MEYRLIPIFKYFPPLLFVLLKVLPNVFSALFLLFSQFFLVASDAGNRFVNILSELQFLENIRKHMY